MRGVPLNQTLGYNGCLRSCSVLTLPCPSLPSSSTPSLLQLRKDPLLPPGTPPLPSPTLPNGNGHGAPQAPPSHLNALRQTSRLASNLPNKRQCRSLVRILCGARSGSSRRYRRRRHHHEVGDVHLRMGRGPTMRRANLLTAAVGVHSVVGSCQQLSN